MTVSLMTDERLAVSPVLGWAVLTGGAVALFATYWDEAWHTDIGRDSAWIAPHLLLYGAMAVAGSAIAAWGVRTWWTTRSLRTARDADGTPLLIAGEPGTGKTSLALGLPHRPGAARATTVVDAAERHVLGSRRWLQRLSERLTAGAPVVVKGIQTLDPGSLSGMVSLIDSTTSRGAVLLTLSAADRAEAGSFATRVGYPTTWAPSLRERAGDVGPLWRALADHAAPSAHLEPTRDALAALEAHAWPGNIVELRNVIEQLALSGRRGSIGAADLPMSVRGARAMSMIERAELEAIQRALHEAGGNRSRAAEILGLSRATVYRKMKTYRLTA